MAPSSTALTTKVQSGSPYQLSQEQTLKASHALLKHMKSSAGQKSQDGKQNLLQDEEGDESVATSIWLTVTTKRHIVDTKRLKPMKISVPHSLNSSVSSTICLITADPQRTFKDLISSPAFPTALSTRITRVIGVSKIKAKFSQYEAQRQLFAEHDIFLADDRIITRLPQLLGKTFYKSTSKRPIPVSLQAPAPRTEGKRIARAKGEEASRAAEPKALAAEIEKSISGALVNLSPSTSTSVRVGYAGWDAAKVAANVEAVTTGIIEKFVTQKWRGVKSVHIKGTSTAALPIWLADELWLEEEDVLDEAQVEAKTLAIAEKAKEKKAASKKRKALAAPVEDDFESIKTKKSKALAV